MRHAGWVPKLTAVDVKKVKKGMEYRDYFKQPKHQTFHEKPQVVKDQFVLVTDARIVAYNYSSNVLVVVIRLHLEVLNQ